VACRIQALYGPQLQLIQQAWVPVWKLHPYPHFFWTPKEEMNSLNCLAQSRLCGKLAFAVITHVPGWPEVLRSSSNR
jgi:hypothetical protein